MGNKRKKGGEKNDKSGKSWTREELEYVLGLYLKLEGKGLHEANPEVIALGEQLGRTTRSVESQLLMFHTCDRGGDYGKMNKICPELWKEYRGDMNVKKEILDAKPPTATRIDVRKNGLLLDLLTWHGHEKKGVHVPFVSGGGELIETKVLTLLEKIALKICEKKISGRLAIFLVGGPGNGKSAAVERFVESLEHGLGLPNLIGNEIKKQTSANGILHRQISIQPERLNAEIAKKSKHCLKSLSIIQDATATESAGSESGDLLFKEIEKVLSSETAGEGAEVFFCCVNRGVLLDAFARSGGAPDTMRVIEKIIKATSNAYHSTSETDCWPLSEAENVFCWPMDVESLTDGLRAPFQILIKQVCCDPVWGSDVACAACASQSLCPFALNVQMLMDNENINGLQTLIRKGELVLGERWNFRDMQSLIAELIVGQRTDFSTGYVSPCDWVHEQIFQLRKTNDLKYLVSLYRKLYFNKTFPVVTLALDDMGAASKLAKSIESAFLSTEPVISTRVRKTLKGDFTKKLDPSGYSPSDDASNLRQIEDIVNTLSSFGSFDTFLSKLEPLTGSFNEIEREFWQCVYYADREMASQAFDNEYKSLREARAKLLKMASGLLKRRVGARKGIVANNNIVDEYTLCISDRPRLSRFCDQLRDVLSKGHQFVFDPTSVYGQPIKTDSSFSRIESGAITLSVPKAATKSITPSYDAPVILVNKDMYITLNYELFSSIWLASKGCSPNCLSVASRAAIEKIKHIFAGQMCRSSEEVDGGAVRYMLGTIKLDGEGNSSGN